jgi:2-polyprenyl-6-methoxyphenol hydroxylase-like FAD-dependent oxidoreductase
VSGLLCGLLSERPILVAGAGIGGLSAAAALLRAGFEVEVFERAPALTEVGAGLTLQSNAMAALRAVGLDEPVAAAGIEVRRTRLASAYGRTYVELDLRSAACTSTPTGGRAPDSRSCRR